MVPCVRFDACNLLPSQGAERLRDRSVDNLTHPVSVLAGGTEEGLKPIRIL
jgi:hypothetical protein